MRNRDLWIGLSLAAIILLGQFAVHSQDIENSIECSNSNISYSVFGQRLLTEKEKDKFPDVVGYKIAITIRLSNDSDDSVTYLSSSFEPRPLGYRWDRKSGTQSWEFLPSTRGRNGLPGTELFGVGYTWRELKPHSSVTEEFLSYSAKGIDFQFSTFLKTRTHPAPCEITTGAFQPRA